VLFLNDGEKDEFGTDCAGTADVFAEKNASNRSCSSSRQGGVESICHSLQILALTVECRLRPWTASDELGVSFFDAVRSHIFGLSSATLALVEPRDR
jgi:hypothetical protein